MSNTSKLEFFPINFFPMVMGLCGFSLSLKNAGGFADIPEVSADIVAWFALSVFVVLLALYLFKAVRFPQRVHGEMNNHLISGFFATIPISMLLLAGCFADISFAFAQILWIVGATGLLMISVMIINRWMYSENVSTQHVTPVWFIPVVGNILVPAMGVEFAPIEFSWMFFSIGFFFWILVFVLVMFRLMFEAPMPLPMAPSMFILLAPPAVGFISWTALNTNLDAMAHMLYYVAAFIFLLLIVELPNFIRLKFNLASWAYSFPLAAMTIATFKMYALSHVEFLLNFAWILEGMLVLLIVWLVIRTSMAVIKGAICIPPKNMKKS